MMDDTRPSGLVVGDALSSREAVSDFLARRGYRVVSSTQRNKVGALLEQEAWDLLIYCPEALNASTASLLARWRTSAPTTQFFLVLPEGCPPPSYGPGVTLLPPLLTNDVLQRHFDPRGRKSSPFPHQRMVVESAPMQQLLSFVERIGPSRANVFIWGESGVGKEVVAQAIHTQSSSPSAPFVKVNCAATPESLAESAFFGHEKGSFTGAYETRKGHFERADGGTLLLDEISEVPLSLQAKLLRVTQDLEVQRVGASTTQRVDVRIISTSNRDLSEWVNQAVLRQDLYYRLNVIPLHIPPLRSRLDDILPLANYFAEKVAWENGVEQRAFSKEAEERLMNYPWPGNVRELAHVVERAMILNDGRVIEASHLFFHPFPAPVAG